MYPFQIYVTDQSLYGATLLIYWACILFYIIYFVIELLRIGRQKEEINAHFQKMEEDSKKFFEHFSTRADLLSRENAKLQDENQELRERLRNMGFKDVDMI